MGNAAVAVMPPISRVLNLERQTSIEHKRNNVVTYFCGEAGFTMLEVLIALLISIILLQVLCSSVSTSLKAEKTIRLLAEAKLLLLHVACGENLGLAASEIQQSLPKHWLANPSEVDVENRSKSIVWKQWSLTPSVADELTLSWIHPESIEEKTLARLGFDRLFGRCCSKNSLQVPETFAKKTEIPSKVDSL